MDGNEKGLRLLVLMNEVLPNIDKLSPDVRRKLAEQLKTAALHAAHELEQREAVKINAKPNYLPLSEKPRRK